MTTYKQSGVDIKLSDKFTAFLQQKSRAIGGFAGLFPIAETGGNCSLVASTDGVGTKLKLAFLLNKHDTIGIDLVAMCVNDLICCGARPAVFLDYYATGKLELPVSKKIIEGIVNGCKQGESLLLGGETAEMPGFYQKGEYDLAGFAVGIVSKEYLIDGSKIKAGDTLIGLKSSGFHSNGYSLIRAALEKDGLLKKHGPALLTPTKIYVKDIKKCRTSLRKKKMDILGLAHITGSGIEGNLERILNKKINAEVDAGAWEVPALMRLVQKAGNIPEKEMWEAFNMGLGMIMAVKKEAVPQVLKLLKDSVVIGSIIPGNGKVIINGRKG